MKIKEALIVLENMPEKQFQEWFRALPCRVRLMVGGGLVNWREILPIWYIKQQTERIRS